MSDWTYSGDPENSGLDYVRFLIGDTIESDQKLLDAEIQFVIFNSTSVEAAAATCARAIAGKFSSRVDERFESIENRFSQAASAYYQLAKRLDQQAKKKNGMGTPIAGGIRVSDMDVADNDTDRVQPEVRRGQFANPPEADQFWWKR